LKHLIETVIPLTNDLPISYEPPLKFPSPPEIQLLGTQSELLVVYKVVNWDKIEEFTTIHTQNKINRRRREIDHWPARQSTIMPIIDDSMVRFPIEILFQYDEQDGMSSVIC
jgi:hypothetical protein